MTATMLDDAECWTAAMARDRTYDGRFVSGVLSTGIYCRPSCPARHPKRENVRFFTDGAAARAAGLRPCLPQASRLRWLNWRVRPDTHLRISSACSSATPVCRRRPMPGR